MRFFRRYPCHRQNQTGEHFTILRVIQTTSNSRQSTQLRRVRIQTFDLQEPRTRYRQRSKAA